MDWERLVLVLFLLLLVFYLYNHRPYYTAWHMEGTHKAAVERSTTVLLNTNENMRLKYNSQHNQVGWCSLWFVSEFTWHWSEFANILHPFIGTMVDDWGKEIKELFQKTKNSRERILGRNAYLIIITHDFHSGLIWHGLDHQEYSFVLIRNLTLFFLKWIDSCVNTISNND